MGITDYDIFNGVFILDKIVILAGNDVSNTKLQFISKLLFCLNHLHHRDAF